MKIDGFDTLISLGRRVKIILEGQDGIGKTTLIKEINNILQEVFPYEICTVRNPHSKKLYTKMHNGHMSAFDIAMATIVDAVELNRKLRLSHFNIVLQDRTAWVSSQVYNMPKMDKAEVLVYEKALMASKKEILGENDYVVVTIVISGDAKRQDNNTFSSLDIARKYDVMTSVDMDFMGNNIFSYHNNKPDITAAAIDVINIANNALNQWINTHNDMFVNQSDEFINEVNALFEEAKYDTES